jgi:hypothetical protein
MSLSFPCSSLPPIPCDSTSLIARMIMHTNHLSQSLPDPLPADLLLPFGDFVTKYGIKAVIRLIWTLGGRITEFPQNIGQAGCPKIEF